MSAPKSIWTSEASTTKDGNCGIWSMPDPVFSPSEMREYGRLEYRLVDPSEPDPKTCKWTKVETHGWGSGEIKTDCGKDEYYDEDFEHRIKSKLYCSYCGNRIEIAESDDD